MNEIEVFDNGKREGEDDFMMILECSFCDRYVRYVAKLPYVTNQSRTYLFICKSCCSEIIEVIDEEHRK